MRGFRRQRFIFCAASLFVSAALQGQTTFSTSSGASGTTGSISSPAAASPYGVPITVSGLSGTISAITVKVNGLTSTDDQSMILAVVSPSGRKLGLIYGYGIGSAQASANVNFSDSGTSLSENGTPNQFTSATYKPVAYSDYLYSTTYSFPSPVGVPSVPATAGSATLGSVFNGDSPNGTWKLYLANVFSGTTSSFSSWSVTITTASAASTSTAVSSSSTNNTSYVGDSVTFTATVTSGGSPVTSGTANFSLNGTVVSSNVALNGLGQATFTTSSLLEGTDSISATYNGNSSFGASTGTLSQTVFRHSTISNVTSTTGTFCNTGAITIPAIGNIGAPPGVASSPYPSRLFVGKTADSTQASDYSGTLTKLTIDLKGFSLNTEDGAAMLLVGPTGAAYDFFSNVGNASSSNNASNLNITLSDSGASQLPTSAISSGTFQPTVYVNTAIGALDTFASPAPSSGVAYAAPAGAVTLAEEFNGTSPNGTWTLYLDDQQSGTGSLASGWCIDVTVSTTNAATTTTLTSSATSNDQFTDQAVTFTATVTSNSTPVTTGTVTFTDGTTQIQSPVTPNASGQVTYAAPASTFTQGTHNITATYSGATGFGTSAATLAEQVDKHTVVTGAQYCNPGTITIPLASTLQSPTPYPVHVFVGGLDSSSTPLAGTIKSVSVTLSGLTASFPSDLQSLLTGPGASSGAGPGGTLSESLDFFSHTANGTAVSNLNLTFADSGSGTVGSGTLISGTFKPTSTRTNTYSSPAPAGPYQYASSEGTATFTTAFASNSLSPNGTWSFYFGTASNSATINNACVTFTTNQPSLTIQKQHTGSFVQGGTATYSITVANSGPGATEGTVTVTEIPPTGMTLSTLSGNNWTCTVSLKTCTRSDSLAQGSSYDTITATLAVSPTATTGPNALTNQASVTGGGASNSPTASDPTTITAAAGLLVTKTHTGNLTQGSTGLYVITVHNGVGAGTTSGTTTVSDSLPTGYTISSFSPTSGTWSCSGTGTQAALCTSSQAITAGSSFPVIDINVNVPANSALTVTNTANAYGGGDPVHTNLGSAATGSDSNASVTQVASSIAATTGSSQTAKISTQFTTQLQATVKDAGSNPVPGVTVTFTAPGTGASGSFTDSNTNITTAVTNSSGIATAAAFKANNTTGGYTVTASAPGVSPNAGFSLTNTTGNPASIAATGGASQSATISTQFGTQLQATVKDAGSNVVQSVTVTFTAPGTGASGTFADSHTNITTAVTNSSGVAIAAAFTANATAGAYSVSASTAGVTPNASFSLTNNAGNASSMAATGGVSQAAAVSTQFATQLQATVKDAGSNLVQNVTVTFTAPGSGASGTFADSHTNITTASTNASGVATAAAFTANGIAGGYSVLASVTGVIPNASFSLTNTGTAATVTSIGSTTANGSYTTGASIAITVTFNKAVNVTGTPQLALNSGGTANYASGSGTSTLTFLYVVAAGQNSTRLDALSNGALILNGGTIQDASTTAANLLLPSPGAAGSLGANTNIVIDTTAPTVVSYSVKWGAQTYSLTGSLRNRLPWQITGIQVVFSKPIATANAASLSGISAVAVSGVGTNTLVWSFSPLTLGTFSTVLAGTGANALKDAAGNPLGGGNGFFRTFRILCGDFNDDGIVNSQDFTLVNAARNQAYNIFADINGDGVVDANDVQIVRNNLGSSLPLPPS